MKEVKITDRIISLEGFTNGSRAVVIFEGNACVLINPPFAESGVYQQLLLKYPVKAVYISNRNYAQQSIALQREFKIPLGVHEEERSFLKYPADFTFKDNQDLLYGIKVVHLQSQKSAGECVFHVKSSRIIVAGDVLTVHTDGFLKMHPENHYQDHPKAQAGLRRLFSLDFEIFLPASGNTLLNDAYEKLGKMYEDLKEGFGV